jgi:hypothetical protein
VYKSIVKHRLALGLEFRLEDLACLAGALVIWRLLHFPEVLFSR